MTGVGFQFRQDQGRGAYTFILGRGQRSVYFVDLSVRSLAEPSNQKPFSLTRDLFGGEQNMVMVIVSLCK